jgi:predicted ester cyclase
VFEALHSGKPISLHYFQEPFVSKDCTYQCAAYPEQKNFAEHVNFVHSLVEGPMPDFGYIVKAIATNESQVIINGTIHGTHTGEGGPVEPSNPPLKGYADFSITFTVNEDGMIVNVWEIMDASSLWKQLGWPLEGTFSKISSKS